MAYYLQMNGTSDYLKTPSVTFTRIVMDIKPYQDSRSAQMWIDSRTGSDFYMYSTSTVEFYSGTNVDGVYVNSVKKTNNTRMVTPGTRVTIEFKKTVAATDDINFLSRNDAIQNLKADIYSIQIYNGATLVASYDMNTQTVQDQSGNGNHATLTGGTWVNDATGTSQEGAASITGVSTITASATVIPAAITGSASLQGVATVSATADVVNAPMVGSASLQGVGTATATASVIRSGSANIMGVSTLTASAAGLSVLGGASLTGVGWVMCSAIEGQFIVSVINLSGVQSFVIALQGSKEQTVQVLGLKDNIVLLEGEI